METLLHITSEILNNNKHMPNIFGIWIFFDESYFVDYGHLNLDWLTHYKSHTPHTSISYLCLLLATRLKMWQTLVVHPCGPLILVTACECRFLDSRQQKVHSTGQCLNLLQTLSQCRKHTFRNTHIFTFFSDVCRHRNLLQ